jgi:hypothetical protein
MPRISPSTLGRGDPAAARCSSRRAGTRAAAFASVFGMAVLLGAAGAASAQSAGGILVPGNAVVTGFSGVKMPASPPAGSDPADLTEIDLAGPSARVVDLQSPGAPPQAQVIKAPKLFTATATQVGQVFAVTLDDATPPNVFVAATSAYGLPIIGPGPGGGAVRLKEGGPNAQFMPGLFGPANAGGGPGSIWRIDGATGEVKLFANVMLDGLANSGTALGGLAFDSTSHTLFVADRGTGMIHAFDQSGTERARFDHGVDGRSAAGLQPVSFDPAGRLDISKPAFKTDDPATWGYAPAERRIFGLAVHGGRLYYATADEQVWSVSVAPSGSFGTDARIELQVQPWDGQSEISKIAFDDQGGMLLAERPGPTGAYDFAALSREGVGRVLHYQQVPPVQSEQAAPGDQPQPANAVAPAPGPSWQPVPDEYAIGFPGEMRNDNGGVAIGYSYTPSGTIDRAACGGFVWATGERLRVSNDQALAARLAMGGPAVVNGLQGNAIQAVRPANVPPLQTYFADYDDQFADPAARGHMGDIAIWRVCGQAFVPAFPAPSLVVPVGFCQRGEIRLPGGECCDRRFVRNGRCGCPREAIRLPDGQCCDPREIRNGKCCTPEQIRNGQCGCTLEQIRNGQCGCTPEQARNGQCGCTPQQIRNGQCRCTPEQARNGQCGCTPEQIRKGQCGCTPEQIRSGQCGCPPDTIRLPNGVCCPRQNVHNGKCEQTPPSCPRGEIMLPNGQCCDPTLVRDGRCVPQPVNCPQGALPNGDCRRQPTACLPGMIVVHGICRCPSGETLVNNVCRQVPPSKCPRGETVVDGACRPIVILTPPRRHWLAPRIKPPRREQRHGTPHWAHRGTTNRTPHVQPRPALHFGNGGRHFR